MTKVLPARAIASIRKEFPIKNRWGPSLKMVIRDEARKLQLYYQPVTVDPLVAGRSDGGKEIPINNLGRWVFGTPGYMGHIIVEGFNDQVAFRCPDMPDVVNLLTKAVQLLFDGPPGAANPGRKEN